MGDATLADSLFEAVWKSLFGDTLKLEDSVYYQVGFGSEHSIGSTGTYWFYCNASNRFVQKCPLCTTDLSHVTDLQKELPHRRSGRAPIVPTVIVLASADTSCHPR